MGKYDLIASTYDPIHNRFIDEVMIQLNGGPKNELVKIDYYTATSSKYQILEELKAKKIIQNQDTLSIRYLKSKDASPVYYNVIFDNERLINSIQYLTERKYYHNFTKFSLSIRLDDPYFQTEWLELKKLIDLKKIDDIHLKYKKQSQLVFLIDRYFNSSYDDDLEKEQDLEEVKLEFSRYKTFRGWIASKNKMKKSISTLNQSSISSKKIKNPISKEEAEKVFDQNFSKKNLIDYKDYLLKQYNQQDMEKEEFIEEDELEQMGYIDDYEKRK